MSTALITIKKLIPKSLFKFFQKPYHFLMSFVAALYYRFPSSKMIVIGVTGTSGKTTVVELIAKVLEGAGHKVGYTSTAKWKIDESEVLNNKKMTMLGRFQTQRMLQEMVQAGCKYAIIETTSQGLEQFRALGIHYDVAVITNLYPEHIDAHGSFENYKKAKQKLFEKLERSKHKVLNNEKIKKVNIANFDDEHYLDFLQFGADEKYVFGIENKVDLTGAIEMRVDNIKLSKEGIDFLVRGVPFKLNIFGQHNIYNALMAICVGVSQGVILSDIAKSLSQVKKIDGKLEKIEAGQDFTVIVDYAFEPNAMTKLYETVKEFGIIEESKKIIHVLGGTGGGRDKARRPILGQLAAKNADIVIITNEDPYDEDPMQIIEEVAKGSLGVKNLEPVQIYKILDRRDAIAKAFELAGEGDLVLITGKGCEQAIVVENEKMIPWDDRTVARDELSK